MSVDTSTAAVRQLVNGATDRAATAKATSLVAHHRTVAVTLRALAEERDTLTAKLADAESTFTSFAEHHAATEQQVATLTARVRELEAELGRHV